MNDYLIQKAQEKAYQTTQKIKQIETLPNPKNLGEIKISRLAERELEKIAPSTGYPDLDRILKGFIPGHVYTTTGVENIGKTSLACNFAVRIAKQEKRVLYFALEPENTVIEYLASVYHDKCFPDLTEEDLSLDIPIEVYGKDAVPTLEKLVEIINNFDRYDLVIIDHIGYFINSQNNWLQQQSNCVKILAGLAKKKQCAILLIAHLRKRSKTEKRNYIPTSDDISGSGAFKQDSTEVMILTRDLKSDAEDEFTYANYGRLYVAKTKSGPNGSIEVYFSDRKANIVSSEEIIKNEKDKKLAEKLSTKAPVTEQKTIPEMVE